MRHLAWGIGVLLAATACGTSATGVTTVANTATLTSSMSTAFTDCMRANGVTDFPGITIDQSGQVHLNLSGSPVDPISATYRAAARTCAHLLPSGSTLPAQPPTPTLAAPHLSCTGADCPATPRLPAPPR